MKKILKIAVAELNESQFAEKMIHSQNSRYFNEHDFIFYIFCRLSTYSIRDAACSGAASAWPVVFCDGG